MFDFSNKKTFFRNNQVFLRVWPGTKVFSIFPQVKMATFYQVMSSADWKSNQLFLIAFQDWVIYKKMKQEEERCL